MNRPLVPAVLAAIAGFGFWIWITGPGTSVPNALIAFVIGIAGGRLVWSLLDRRREADEPTGTEAAVPPPLASRVAPPTPPETPSWRLPDKGGDRT